MKRDGPAASRPLASEWGHRVSPRPLCCGPGDGLASALCQRSEEGEGTDDESLPQVVY